MEDVRAAEASGSPAGEPLIGRLIRDRYRITGLIASGGMSRVYTADDTRLTRTVAVKIVRSSQADNPQVLAAFRREAWITARLSHPHVVAVFDQGEHAGRPYLVMEYVAGRTLRDILNARVRIPPAQALGWSRQVLDALAVAHRAGFVHRDVKPENILIGHNFGADVVKVADFGLAQPSRPRRSTPDGPFLATAVYLAPELITGGAVDARTDVYAVGIMLYEMLTGQVPFDGPDPTEVAWQHARREVPSVAQIRPELTGTLSRLVQRATSREPDARFRDAAAFAIQLAPVWRRLSANENPRLPRQRPASRRPGRAARPRRRHPLARRLAAGALTVLIGLSMWWCVDRWYVMSPSLSGRHLATATELASDQDVPLRFAAERFSDTVPAGVVLDQKPAAGSPVHRGDPVTVTVSRGPHRYSMPSLSGHGRDYAADRLAGLSVTVRLIPDDGGSAAPGTVLTSDPSPGDDVLPGDVVTLRIARDARGIDVPDVIGRSRSEAVALFGQAGLVIAPGAGAGGRVVAQDLMPGTRVPAGTVASITLSG